jgi:Rrf2 family protein
MQKAACIRAASGRVARIKKDALSKRIAPLVQLFAQTGDLGPNWFHVSLRTLVLLAGSNDLMKSHVIAGILGADPSFVRKILKRLAKNGIVLAQGGRSGGYSLARSSDDITVGDVYRALSGGTITSPLSVKPTGTEPFIAMIVSKAEKQFKTQLDAHTIRDIQQHAYSALMQSKQQE